MARPPPPPAPGAAHLGRELDVRPGPVLQQQPHPVHIPSLDGEEEDLHGRAAQVGVSAAVQQEGDGRPPAPVSGRSRETVTGWRRGTRGPQPRHAPGRKETPPRMLARPDVGHADPGALPHQTAALLCSRAAHLERASLAKLRSSCGPARLQPWCSLSLRSPVIRAGGGGQSPSWGGREGTMYIAWCP